jgi:DNA-binding transcriptional regulator YiaG
MMNSSLKELFARAGRIPGDARVSSGSPAVCVLRRLRRSPATIPIARALMRRHVPVKDAYDAITRLLTEESVTVRVPMVEDSDYFQSEIRSHGAEVVSIKEPRNVDAKSVREQTGLSQEQFATTFGLDVATVRNWEQGRSSPDTAARVLLAVIEKEPEAVKRALLASA